MPLINKNQAIQICTTLHVAFVKLSFLAKGNHNSNYLLETSEQKYVIRIEDNKQFKNLKKEFLFLKKAGQKLGPEVYLFDNSHRIIPHDFLVEEFVTGKHPSAQKPGDDFIIQIAQWFKKLHRTKKPVRRPVLLLNKVRPYHRNILKNRQHLPKELQKKTLTAIEKGLASLRKYNKIFTTRKTLSLLHNDTSSENIFYEPGSVRLIDWEFVNYDLPERELVYFLDSYHLTDKQKQLFLLNYGYQPTPSNQLKLNLVYLILLFSSIGYSLWQLDILSRSKPAPVEITNRLKRLKRDVNLREKTVASIH